MCEDRNVRWFDDVVSHPKYQDTIKKMYDALDKDPDELKNLKTIDIEDSNLEYLIGVDQCTFRSTCKTKMGDRSYKISKKRYESKIQMLDVYREAMALDSPADKSKTKKKDTKSIFDIDS